MPKRVNRRPLVLGIVTGVPTLARERRGVGQSRPRPTRLEPCPPPGGAEQWEAFVVTILTYDRNGQRVGPVRKETRRRRQAAVLASQDEAGDRLLGKPDGPVTCYSCR
jgi:hypothetical protein